MVIILIIAIFAVFADTRMTTQLNTIASSQAKNISTRVINDAVMEVLTDNDIKYDDLVRIEYDDSNRVSAIKTDSIKMNRLQSMISSKISERIAEVESREISLAIGSLVGIDLFYNRGPKVKIKLTLSGNATTAIENAFESAGINQTRHQINMTIKTTVYVVLSGGSTSAEVVTNITIAETIIVGLVPEFYADGGLGLSNQESGIGS